MSYIFISYCRDDAKIANQLKQSFEKAELNCWIDKDSIYSGEAWQSAIEEGIWGCAALVVIVSEKSIRSQWVTYEWMFARGAEKPVFPVLVDEVKDYHPRLQLINGRKYDDPSDVVKLIEHLLLEVNQFQSSAQIPPRTPQYIRNWASTAFGGITPHAEEIKAAINQIARTDHASAHSILASALGSDNRDIRIKVLVAMRDHKVYTIEAVENLVRLYPDVGNLYYAVQELLVGIGPSAIDKLIPFLKSDQEKIRALIYEVLGKIEGFDQLSLFREGLTDQSRNVRHAIVSAARQVNNPESFDILLEILRNETEYAVYHRIQEALIAMLTEHPRGIDFEEGIERLKTASAHQVSYEGGNVIRAVLSKFKR